MACRGAGYLEKGLLAGPKTLPSRRYCQKLDLEHKQELATSGRLDQWTDVPQSLEPFYHISDKSSCIFVLTFSVRLPYRTSCFIASSYQNISSFIRVKSTLLQLHPFVRVVSSSVVEDSYQDPTILLFFYFDRREVGIGVGRGEGYERDGDVLEVKD